MLVGVDDLEHRAIDAAAAYLERAGFEGVEKVGPDCPYIAAVDNGERVAVMVSVSRAVDDSSLTEPDYLPDGFSRLDAIRILVISEDRALLRHHRGVGGD